MTRATTTISLNGRLFDARSGMPISDIAPAPATKKPVTAQKPTQTTPVVLPPHVRSDRIQTTAHAVHAKPERSQTLRRQGLAKPAHHPVTKRPVRPAKSYANVAQSSLVQHFKPDTETFKINVNRAEPVELSTTQANLAQNFRTDMTASSGALLNSDVRKHPAHHTHTAAKPQPAAVRNTESIHPHAKREQVVAHQLAHAPAHHAAEHHEMTHARKHHLTRALIIVGVVVLAVAGIGFAYFKLPSASLLVAAHQAGIEASYPGYVPAGYSYSGPISYKEGEVKINFNANGSSDKFTLTEKRSSYDSGAVLDNYVLPQSASYLTYSEKGLTIYTFGSQAAWVDSGILRTITGDANLTSDQILRIAGSM